MKLTDLDYFKTRNGMIFIVRGNHHLRDGFLCCPVYWPEYNGDRVHLSGQKYRKEIIEVADDEKTSFPFAKKNKNVPRNVFIIPQNEIVEVFRPRAVIAKFKKEFPKGIWRQIFDSIREAGVLEEDIGIFGSYLVGLSGNPKGGLCKDIDFLVYGKENCYKLKRSIGQIVQRIGCAGISENHVNYESKKLGGLFDPAKNSFLRTLSNKWSSIQVGEGVLSTIRFVAKPGEEVLNLIANNPISYETTIRGIVVDDFGSSFVPRIFQIFDGSRYYKILSYFWVYHQAVKNGDLVEITGNKHERNGIISIDRYRQGIKIIAEQDELLPLQQRHMQSFEASWGRAESIAS